MDIGILGGTFNPIHIGHLVAAEEARMALGLREVLFIPAGQSWLKGDRAILPAEHRVEMVRLAIVSNPHFKLSTLEVERPGESYSVDTMEELRRQYGSAGRLFFILGSDSLMTLPRWKQPARLVQLCQLVVMNRPGPPPNMAALEESIPGVSRRIVLLDMPGMDVSSTDIRERVLCGRSIRYLVPAEVENYILEHRLYR